MTTWVYDDGGRAASGRRGRAGDCVPRAIAIVTGLPYADVYDGLQARQRDWLNSPARDKRARRARERSSQSVRDGTWPEAYRPWLAELGLLWTPTMSIGSGTRVHLRADELPAGRLLVRCSRHLTAVIDGTIHDTYDPSRDGTRAVYGYWAPGNPVTPPR